MPGIGNPYSTKSAFSKIKMRKAAAKKSPSSKKQDVADKLNKLAGVDDKKFFVDAEKHNKIGKDGFLKLLATQLKNQDPSKPMDQKRFAADLAQFAQLEQLTNVNTKLEKSLAGTKSKDKFYGASFLGKEVITRGTSIHLDGDGKGVYLPFSLDKDASKIIVRIFDKNKQMIKQIDSDAMTKGSNSISWNGKASDGYLANKGDYSFKILAWDEGLNQFKGETKSTGIVSGVSFKGDQTILQLSNGKKVFLRDVNKFQLPNITQGVKNIPALNKVAHKVYNNNKEIENL